MAENRKHNRIFLRDMRKDYQIYLILLPTLVYFFVYCYIPMLGIQIAFKEYSPSKGIMGSPWVGFEQFTRFFNSYQFRTIIFNTLEISLYNLLAGFPIPILLALLINQLNYLKLKKALQTITYAPHFISVPAVVGMLVIMLSPGGGFLFRILEHINGGDIGLPMGTPSWFSTIYVISGIWQHSGWDAIIYIASLTAINPELYEAADIDGAGKLYKILNIDIPSIIPTAVVLLILNSGRILSVGFEKVLLMQNSMNITKAEIISTYVYKVGLLNMDFSYSAAIGLFNSVVNFTLIMIVNKLARQFSDVSIW